MWNYRVVQKEKELRIHEVYYGEEDKFCTVNPIAVAGPNVEELKWQLERMLESLNKPILNYETLEEEK
jgi:hypothetical protein